MISFELAKQLKDAGFPQNPNGRGYECFEPRGEFCNLIESEHIEKCDDWDCKRCKTPDVYPPTLSELIEACMQNGATFSHLRFEEGKWKAQGFHNEKDIFVYNSQSTPEEAVANLWLEINKKQ